MQPWNLTAGLAGAVVIAALLAPHFHLHRPEVAAPLVASPPVAAPLAPALPQELTITVRTPADAPVAPPPRIQAPPSTPTPPPTGEVAAPLTAVDPAPVQHPVDIGELIPVDPPIVHLDNCLGCGMG